MLKKYFYIYSQPITTINNQPFYPIKKPGAKPGNFVLKCTTIALLNSKALGAKIKIIDMSDIWDSFTEYVKTRLTNPFLATLIVVWIIRNFTFVFSLFNFDSGETREQKLEYIENYLSIHETWSELGWNVSISFSVIFSSFILLLVSRALTNGYSLALSFLNKHTAKSTMIEVEDHNKLLLEYTNLKKERDTFRSEASSHDSQLKDFLNRLTQKTDEADILSSKVKRQEKLVENSQNEKLELSVEHEKLKKDYNELLLSYEYIKTHQNLDIENIDPDRYGMKEYSGEIVYTEQIIPDKIPENNVTTTLKNEKDRIIKRFSDFKHSPDYDVLSKNQKIALHDLADTGRLLEMIYYLNHLINLRTAESYIEVSHIQIFITIGFIKIKDPQLVNINETRYNNLTVSVEGKKLHDFLIRGTSLDPIVYVGGKR